VVGLVGLELVQVLLLQAGVLTQLLLAMVALLVL
jgi:hypothetical protein